MNRNDELIPLLQRHQINNRPNLFWCLYFYFHLIFFMILIIELTYHFEYIDISLYFLSSCNLIIIIACGLMLTIINYAGDINTAQQIIFGSACVCTYSGIMYIYHNSYIKFEKETIFIYYIVIIYEFYSATIFIIILFILVKNNCV